MAQRLRPWLRMAAVATALGLAGHGADAAELRIANSGEPDTLDPHHASGVWENRIIGDMFMGLTTEAADAMGTPVGTARSRLHYALQSLRAAIDADARMATKRGTA